MGGKIPPKPKEPTPEPKSEPKEEPKAEEKPEETAETCPTLNGLDRCRPTLHLYPSDRKRKSQK